MLGTPIAYTHRAAVARLHTRTKYLSKGGSEPERYWELHEGSRKGMKLPDLKYETAMFDGWKPVIMHQRSYRGRPSKTSEAVNKTIMVWPEEGSGVVTGLVRRGIGRSESGYHSGPDGDWSEGYFSGMLWFELYAVRCDLRGLDYLLIPQWAASPLRLEQY